MYASSKQTVFFKYYFPFLFILGFGTSFLASGFVDTAPDGFKIAFAIMSVWLSIFFIQVPFRLKKITTLEKGILVKGRERKLIPYADIESVSKFDLAGPWFMTIKYFDQKSGDTKKICFMPSHTQKRTMADDAITAFIKERMKEENPQYNEEDQPSTMRNFMVLMLLSLPFSLTAIYFFLLG
ncbi:hypothetical protein [Marinifilum fragile]|uniref:hypothetical protein n=1 Tax=Marinifilum fragile TaxID=570161 RepID=UPI002AA6EB90|nr:hypothetical protein [Marinifilum fragile]